MKRFLVVLALAACAGAQSGSPRQLDPPVAKKVPHPTMVNGETLRGEAFREFLKTGGLGPAKA